MLHFLQEENEVLPSSSGRSDDHNCHCSSRTFDLHKCSVDSSENWKVLPTYGNKPTPRFHVIGSPDLLNYCRYMLHPRSCS